jgi:hypothetical protein
MARRQVQHRAQRADVMLLAAIVSVSCALYVHRIGFYSDDWTFLASLSRFGDYSHVGRPDVIDWADYLDPRPVQMVYQWLLFSAFGMQPLGYHIVNSLILVTGAVLIYLSAARLGATRAIAFALPAVYALLPHYSTGRFWFAAFGYPLVVLCCFAHLYTNLRAATERGSRRVWWKSVGVISCTLGALGYEIALPLLVANIVVVTWHVRRINAGTGPTGLRRIVAFWSVDIAVLAAAVLYKVTIPGGIEAPSDLVMHSLRLLAGSAAISFGSFGIGLAEASRWGVAVAGIPTLVAAAAVMVAVFVHLMRCTTQPWLGRRAAVRLAGGGLAVFLLGYSVFVFTTRIYFSSSGISNRVAIAGTIGFAMVTVASAALVSSLLRSEVLRRMSFSLLIALLCGVGLLVTAGLADQWSLAWQREQEVLDVMSGVEIPEGANVLLSGVCPYVGPAPVFESNWDLTGALEILYDDSGIQADVTTTRHWLESTGITTEIYGSIRAHYPYGNDLILIRYPQTRSMTLPNRRIAESALDDETHLPDGCSRGIAGAGQPLFSIDGIYHRFEQRYLWP